MYVIYKNDQSSSKRWYLTGIPRDGHILSGIGYQSQNDGRVPDAAGTCPTENDAVKLCDYLRTAAYGPPVDHFYERIDV